MDEYLKTLLQQIRCKNARPYVKNELQDHIEDESEANMQEGMDREQAERVAVR
ncbi:permease prefix domain 1-containing protein, partial [Blautia wexlerae]|uniref:permease prefix domain 1-containing protein n=1 Tax=Blautia wexlerae TaxID=418240 RepID=UPI00210A00AC